MRMAGDSGSSFPFTALSVAVLFLSSTYLAQHGFELWRQPDSDAKRVQLAEPPVDARLWEDPLGALNRHRQRLKELCPTDTAAVPKTDKSAGPKQATAPVPVGGQGGARGGTGSTKSEADKSGDGAKGGDGATAQPGGQLANPFCGIGQPLLPTTFKEQFDTGKGVTLIAAILPGGAVVGAEEMRRRSRYAVLAGLNVAGYVPNDSERMGLVSVDRCESLRGCVPPDPTPRAGGQDTKPKDQKPSFAPMDIVYERLTPKDATGRQIAVLWIDDTAVGRRWLSAVAMLLKDLSPPAKDVERRILGTAGSDSLVKVLGDDLAALADEANGAAKGDAFSENWPILAGLRLFSSQSTAPAAQLWPAAGLGSAACSELSNQKQLAQKKSSGKDPTDCVAKAFASRLEQIGNAKDHLKKHAPPAPFFVRTIGTDDLLVRRLIDELHGRGIDQCTGDSRRRIVLISEWDSIYARTFSDTLREQLQCTGKGYKVTLQTYSYLRGLDGATPEGLSTQVRRGSDNARGGDKGPPVEWPEGRAQSDYVRRLVEEIRRDNDDYPVQAIGIIGSDVHDKLVLMQALRDVFPDRMLFTTDNDARLSHPSATRYTRNVIVASSLPLRFEEEPVAAINRIGPFRDAYQTAAYLAARLAAMAPQDLPDDKGNVHPFVSRVEAAVAEPKLFEVGRDSMIGLPAKGIESGERDKRYYSAAAAFGMLLSLAGLTLVGRPGPAMQHAWQWWSVKPQASINNAHVVIAGLQAAALGFASGVVLELAVPGSAGAFGPLLLALAAVLFFRWVVFPGRPWARELRPSAALQDARAKRRRLVWRLALVGVAAAVIWYFVVAQPTDAQMHEPFAPLSGVSAWPSELLRTLAIVLFAWFLDEAWCTSVEATEKIGTECRLFPTTAPAWPRARGWKRLHDAALWLRQPSTTLDDTRRVDGTALWNQYRMLMSDGVRFDRVLVALVLSGVALLLVAILVNALTDSPWPGLPARGLADRALFWTTVVVSAVAVVVLLVVVGDVTVLTMWLVDRLRDGRTVYPTDTVKRFAEELGPDLWAKACEPIEAYPDQRRKPWSGPGPAPAQVNSILDDWIDARLLAEHTAAIGGLIIFPFILVGLLVVGRSRLFDNWEIGGSVLVVLVIYLLWSIALAAMLNLSAERARRKALDGMKADLLWMKGATGYEKLAKSFEGLIEDVRTLRKGAFAPFFEQPLVQAILVPLGGAGGAQLLDWLLYARAQ
jgi:hypothetical protein